MHPVIRVSCLLIFAVLAPWLPSAALVAAAAALLAWGLFQPASGRAMWRGLRRIRWLLLSILILYLWFTPGAMLFPALGAFSPTYTGLLLAAERAGVLMLIMMAAAGVLAVTPVTELSAALRILLTWPADTKTAARFADRIGLLLDEFPRIEARVRGSLRDSGEGIAARAANLFHDVETAANGAHVDTAPAPCLQAVPLRQWLLPFALLIAGGTAAMLT